MRHPGHRLEGHLDHLMGAHSGGGGDKADAACIVFAGRIEGRSRESGGVSRVVLTGTGRVDPLPIGGHGAS
jgi:hypothetical protein